MPGIIGVSLASGLSRVEPGHTCTIQATTNLSVRLSTLCCVLQPTQAPEPGHTCAMQVPWSLDMLVGCKEPGHSCRMQGPWTYLQGTSVTYAGYKQLTNRRLRLASNSQTGVCMPHITHITHGLTPRVCACTISSNRHTPTNNHCHLAHIHHNLMLTPLPNSPS